MTPWARRKSFAARITRAHFWAMTGRSCQDHDVSSGGGPFMALAVCVSNPDNFPSV